MEKQVRNPRPLTELLTTRLQSEIAKLKDVEIFSNALSIEVAFNSPRSGIIKEIADAMKMRSLGRPFEKFSMSKFVIKNYDGVLIIPIKNKKPVIVFKKFGKGLSQLRIFIDIPFFEEALPAVSSYIIFWNEKIWNKWPPAVLKQYPKYFNTDIINLECIKQPVDVIELPLKVVLGETKLNISDVNYITPVRDALRKLDVLYEKRGKGYRKIYSTIKLRDRFLISQYKKMNSPNRLPIKKLQELLLKKADVLFSDDSALAEKHYCDDMTVRRVLQKHKKEEKARKELIERRKNSTPKLRALLKEYNIKK